MAKAVFILACILLVSIGLCAAHVDRPASYLGIGSVFGLLLLGPIALIQSIGNRHAKAAVIVVVVILACVFLISGLFVSGSSNEDAALEGVLGMAGSGLCLLMLSLLKK